LIDDAGEVVICVESEHICSKSCDEGWNGCVGCGYFHGRGFGEKKEPLRW
jgi:hypothetical protein